MSEWTNNSTMMCQACGKVVLVANPRTTPLQVYRSYVSHARSCIGLKKLIVLDRRTIRSEREEELREVKVVRMYPKTEDDCYPPASA